MHFRIENNRWVYIYKKRKDETMMTKKIIAMKNYLRMRNEGLKDFLWEEDGVGVVEVILILVVIIGLVLIFKEQLNTLVESLFETINDKAGSV